MVFAKNENGSLETIFGQRKRITESFQKELLKKSDEYTSDLRILEDLNSQIHNADGSLKELSETQSIYNDIATNSSARVKAFGQQMIAGTKTIEDYKKECEVDTNIKKQGSFTDGLKSLGSSLLSGLLNGVLSAVVGMAVGALFTGVYTLFDNIVHKTEKLIEKGEEAKETINSTFDEFASGQKTIKSLGKSFASSEKDIKTTGDAIESVADKYAELSEGVNSTNNENQSLSTDEYETYLDLCNELAEQFPSLVSGYDEQGNAILNLGNNADIAAERIKNLYDIQRMSANVEIGNNIQDMTDGTLAQIDEYQKEIDGYKEEEDHYREIANSQDIVNELAERARTTGEIVIDPSVFKEDTVEFQNAIINVLRENGIGYTTEGLNEQYYDTDTDTYIQGSRLVVGILGDQDPETLYDKFADTIIQSPDKYASLANEAASNWMSIELLQQDQWKSMASSFGSYLQTSSAFNDLNEDITAAFISNIGVLDLTALKEVYDGNSLKFLYGEFIEPLSQLNESTQEALSDLFNIDVSEMPIEEYLNTVEEAFEKAFPNDKEQQNKWRDAFGIGETVEQNTEMLLDLKRMFPNAKEYIASKTQAELSDLYDFVKENDFEGSLSEAFVEMEKIALEKEHDLSSMEDLVTSASSALSTYSSVISESSESTGLTADSITLLKSQFASLTGEGEALENYDFGQLFANTADGVKLNCDALEDLIDLQHDIDSSKMAKSIELQNKKIKEQQKLVNQYKNGTDLRLTEQSNLDDMYAELQALYQAQSQMTALYAQQKELFSDYAAWQTATGTENAGDKYTEMITGLEAAKEAYDAGLVGTDDFKTFAALLSPTGSTDATNFAENYAKAARYLTEDSTGIFNFLNDLQTKGMATFDSLSETWSIDIENMTQAAREMGINENFLEIMFGRMEDYGAVNNFVTSVEDGQVKINEMAEKLVKANMELAELENTGANDTAIQAKLDEIATYEQSLSELHTNVERQAVNDTWQQKEDFDIALAQLKLLGEEYQDASGEYKDSLERAMQSIADEYGIELEADFTINEESLAQVKKDFGYGDWKNPLTASDFGYEEGSKEANTFSDLQEGLKQYEEDSEKFIELKKYTADELKQIVLGDGEYNVDGMHDAEDALQALADEFGYTDEDASVLVDTLVSLGIVLDELNGKGVEEPIESTLSLYEEEIATAESTIQSLGETLNEAFEAGYDKDSSLVQQIMDDIMEESEGTHIKVVFDAEGHFVGLSTDGTENETESSSTYEDLSVDKAKEEKLSLPERQSTVTDSTNDEEFIGPPEFVGPPTPQTQEVSVELDESSIIETKEQIEEPFEEPIEQTISPTIEKPPEENTEITFDTVVDNIGTALDVFDTLNATIAQLQSREIPIDTMLNSEQLLYYAEIIASLPEDMQLELGINAGNLNNASDILEQLIADSQDTVEVIIDSNADEFVSEVSSATDTVSEVLNESYVLTVDIDEASVSNTTSIMDALPKEKQLIVDVDSTEAENTLSIVDRIFGQPDNVQYNVSVNDEELSSATEDKTATVKYQPDYTEADESEPESKESIVDFSPNDEDIIKYIAPDKEAYVKYYVNADNINSWTPANKTAYIDYRQRMAQSTGTMTSIASHADGTVPYNVLNTKTISRAYAEGGKIALTHDEIALSNELGNESIIRDGVWSLLPPGMHLQAFKKGDIILNAKQTADLLEHGRASGVGKAYADGTAPHVRDIASAHGSGTGSLKFQGGAAGKTLGTSSSSTTKYEQQASNSVVDAAESAEDLFDWIEVLLTRLQSKTDGFIQKAENAVKLSTSLKYYDKAIANISEQKAANEAGAKRYKKQADAVELDDSIKELIRNGKIDITEYDEDTQDKISDYQQWYEKSIECEQNIVDLQEQMIDLAQTKLDTIIDKYDTLISRYDSYIDKNDAAIEYRKTTGYSDTNKEQKKIYQSSIQKEQSILASNQKAQATLQKEIDAQIASGLMKVGDDRWQEAQATLQEYDTAIYESKTAIEEWEQTIRNMKVTKLERAIEAITRWADQLADLLSLKEARGEKVTEKDYKAQITANNDEMYKQYQLLKQYEKEQANYEKDSEKWNEYENKKAEAKSNINNLAIENEGLKDSIVSVRWDDFDSHLEDMDYSITEIEFLRGLLNDSVSATGELTADGQANIALIGQAMSLENQTIADCAEGLKKLDEQYKNGLISEEEYNEKKKELQNTMRDSTTAMADYREELIDLYKEQLKARNDVLLDNIELWKKAAEEQENYYNYDKQVKNQRKTINSLKAQAAALEGVTSAAGKAKLAKIKAELAEAEEDMDDIKHEHAYELKISGYETLADDVNEQFDLIEKELETNAEFQEQVVNSMLENIKTGYKDAYSTVDTLIKNTGVSISDTTKDVVDGLSSMTDAYKLFKDATKNPDEYKPSSEAKDIKTSNVETNKTSSKTKSGKTITTDKAIAAAAQKEDTSNANTTKEPSDTGTSTGKATSISLNKTSVTIKVGKTVTLTASCKPVNANVSYSWKTSNKAVATVSKGTIKGVKAGTATITVKDSVSGKTATCKITVKNTTTSSSSASNIWASIPKDNSEKGNSSLDTNNSIIDRMKYNGYSSDYASRKQLWTNLKGSGAYTGTAEQNIWLLKELKKAEKNGTGSTSATTASSSDIWANIPKDTSMKGNSSLDKNNSIMDRMRYNGYTGNYTTQKQLWSNLKGSGTYIGSAAQNAWLIEQLKKAGYSTGGVVGTDTFGILKRAAVSNGDNGFGLLTAGESVMPLEFTELLPQGLKILEEVAKIDIPAFDSTSQQPIINTNLVFNVEQVSNDIDLDAFSKKIQKEVSQNIVREVKKLR